MINNSHAMDLASKKHQTDLLQYTLQSYTACLSHYMNLNLLDITHYFCVLLDAVFRFCPFPQEITLQMEERCQIRKLQLLAHQYMISAKVEFHIGDRLPEPASPHDLRQTLDFQRLG